MGFLDHYRRFEGLSEQEVNAGKREQATQRKLSALAQQEPLDLASTTWPEYPPHVVVNAITFAARKGLNRYRDRSGEELRAEIAARHALPVTQLAVGDGAAQLLSSAARELLSDGDELITPWPSYGLYPLMARRARAAAVPVDGFAVDALLGAVNQRTRVIALCNPNDPTGALLPLAELERLLGALPERVVVLLDEALRDFVSAEPVDATFALLERHPRLLIFRTFSKAWGLAGLRVGYTAGAAGAEPLLRGLEPEMGIDDLAQAGVLEALRGVAQLPASRNAQIAAGRDALTQALITLGVEVAPTQANVLWARLPGVTGAELHARLRRGGILTAAGAALGDADRVRITVPHLASGAERLLRAVELARR